MPSEVEWSAITVTEWNSYIFLMSECVKAVIIDFPSGINQSLCQSFVCTYTHSASVH